jgi:hypothetical protein
MHGLAARMKLELAELARRHRVPDPIPVTIPPSPPPMGDVILEGLATSREVPLDRVKMRPWFCPLWPNGQDNPPVKLLYQHDTTQPAGKIERLEWDARGQLRIRARVSHSYAKTAGAFSVSAKVLAYELRDVDTPNFYALVTSAEIPDEISLTHTPCDPHALVLHRSAPSALDENYAKTLASVNRLKAMVAALPSQLILVAAAPQREPAMASPRREMTPQDRIRLAAIHERAARKYHASYRLPVSSSSFSTMAAQLNSRLEA